MPNKFTTGIVRIIHKIGVTVGAGFVVTDDGLIVTCAHVIEKAGAGPGESVELIFHTTKESVRAQVISEWWRDSDAEDLAILRLEGELPEDVNRLQLGSSAKVKGKTFDTFGFPDAKPNEGLAGECKVIGETTEFGHRVLQIQSKEVTLGFSGAPIWDAELGVVVGIVTSILTEDKYGKQREIAFNIPVETLRGICPNLAVIPDNPYRGLEYFREEDADFYFGRQDAAKKYWMRYPGVILFL